MATKNLSEFDANSVPSGKGMRIAIVAAEWNWEITGAMARGASETLASNGVNPEDIEMVTVPGTFELPLGGQLMADTGRFDAVILIGCVIQGETRHFDFICQGVTQGTTDLNLKYNLPFIFGVLTTGNQQQALDRAGGIHGNKGDEAAVAALKMVTLKRNLQANK